jgi:hypothetical protein
MQEKGYCESVCAARAPSQRLNQLEKARGPAGFSSAAYIELAIDALDMGLNGIEGDHQFFSDFQVSKPCAQQTQNTLLLLGKRLEQRADSVV